MNSLRIANYFLIAIFIVTYCTLIQSERQSKQNDYLNILKSTSKLLFQAIYSHDKTEILNIIESNKKILYYILNRRNETNFTPLDAAVLTNDLETVGILCSRGANANLYPQDKTPLHLSASQGNINMTKYLVEKCGAYVNSVPEINHNILRISLSPNLKGSPMHSAISNGHLDVLQYLIGKGGDVDIYSENVGPPLFYAVTVGKLNIVQYLIAKGANYSVTFKGNNLLEKAAATCNLQLTEYLLQKIPMQKRLYEISAQKECNEEYLNLLNSHGIDIDSKSLIAAAEKGNVNILTYLIQHGINLTKEDYGLALLAATSKENWPAANYLIDQGTNVNVAYNAGAGYANLGKTPLSFAVEYGQIDIVNRLLAQNATINYRSEQHSLLLRAIETLNLNIISNLIIKGKADVNSEEPSSGLNSLSSVCNLKSNQSVEIVKLLIAHGANIYQPLSAGRYVGKLPLEICLEKSNLEVVKYLIHIKALESPLIITNTTKQIDLLCHSVKQRDVNLFKTFVDFSKLHSLDVKGVRCSSIGRDLVNTACLVNNNLPMLKYLVEDLHLDVNIRDNENSTAILTCSVNDDEFITKYLISVGADINVQDKSKYTLAHYAAKKGQVGILEVLYSKNFQHWNNVGGYNRVSALHEAIKYRKSFSCIEFLVRVCKVNVNVVDYVGKSSLHYIFESSYNYDILMTLGQLLVSHGAQVNLKAKNFKTPIQIYLEKKIYGEPNFLMLSILQFFIRSGATVSNLTIGYNFLEKTAPETVIQTYNFLKNHGFPSLDSKGQNALHAAATIGNFEFVKFLISQGIDVNSYDKLRNTPLHLHLERAELNVEIIQALLRESNDSVNSVNSDGHTPLINLVKNTKFVKKDVGKVIECINLLVSYGANINYIIPSSGENILYYISSHEILQVFITHGVIINNSKNKGGNNILHQIYQHYPAINTKEKLDFIFLILTNSNNLIDEIDKDGKNLLILAAAKAEWDIVYFLLRNPVKVNLNQKTLQGDTLIHYIVSSRGNFPLLRMLVSKGGNYNETGRMGLAPIQIAVEKSHKDYDAIGFLSELGAYRISLAFDSCVSQPDWKCVVGMLHYGKGLDFNDQIVDKMIKLNTPVRILQLFISKGGAALSFSNLVTAADKGNLETFKLIWKNLQVNNFINERYTEILMKIIENSHSDLQIFQFVWNFRNQTSNFDTSRVIYKTAEVGNWHIFDILIPSTSNFNQTLPKEMLAISNATIPLRIAKFLVEHGASTNESFRFKTPMKNMIFGNNFEVVKFLIENGVQLTNNNLHSAILNGNVDITKILLQHGANANAIVVSNGYSTLHNAILGQNNPAMVQLLIEFGSNVNAQAIDFESPLHFAVRFFKTTVIKILVERGNANVNLADKKGQTPLLLAASYGEVIIVFPTYRGDDINATNTVRYLLEKGANVNALNKDVNSPLHHAVKGLNRHTIKVLLQFGVDINLKNSKGQSALELAKELNTTGGKNKDIKIEIVQLLETDQLRQRNNK